MNIPCNAPGLSGPPDADETFLELVCEYMQSGMSQDDAEIAAQNKIDEWAESARYEAGEDAYEARMSRRYGYD